MVAKQLAEDWKKAGVRKGDVLLVHSSVSRTYRRCMKQGWTISAIDILESFLEVVGPSGTLLLPLFNFDFTKGTPFDIRTTPSHMGQLTEAGRQYPSSVRSGHPIYSFAAIGYHADRFRDVDNFSGYGSDSPFAILRELDGRIAVLDLPDSLCMTFVHHAEEMNNVDYRYHKTFTGAYTDATGITEQRTYGLFVRDLERGIRSNGDPAAELMWQGGLYRGFRPKEGCGLRTISARAMFDFLSDIITSGRAENLIYYVEKNQNG